MEISNNLFIDNTDNSTEKIINKIKNGEWGYILNGLCYVNENKLILNYIFFKHFASNQTYNFVLNYIIKNIDDILTNNSEFIVCVNLKHLTIVDIDKHKQFIQNISGYLKDKYPRKMQKCYIYNAPFVFNQIFTIISMFIDKDTQKKIELVNK